MSISQSYDWTLNRDQIISATLKKLRVIGRGEVPNEFQIADGASVLNRMVKGWQARKVFLWTYEWATKTISLSTEKTGSNGKIYTCTYPHTSATVNQPISGAEFSKYWALYGSTGGSWSAGQSYTSAGIFDVDADCIGIDKAFIRVDESDKPIHIINSHDAFGLNEKGDFGEPNTMWLNRTTITTPRAMLYPIPITTANIVHFLKVRKLRDFDLGTDNADFPVQWIDALVCNLAYKWANEFGLDPRDYKDEAKETFSEAYAGQDDQEDSQFIRPAYRL